jgi:hypothetical protein
MHAASARAEKQNVTNSDSDSDRNPPARPGKKQWTETQPPKHLVRCCHCTKTWGPYNAHYTTTSSWKRHVEVHHREIPAEEGAERALIKEIRENAASGQTGSPWIKAASGQTETPWTKAAAYGEWLKQKNKPTHTGDAPEAES